MKKTKAKKRIRNNNKDNNIILVNNTKIIGHPIRPNNITLKILRLFFKELLLIGNINVALDVSKIGRRRGNDWLKRGKIALENNILEDQYYAKFYALSTRTHAKWISLSIQKLQETNNRGGNNLQWLLEQQAPDDFKKLQENNDSNATNLILALQGNHDSLQGNHDSLPGKSAAKKK